MVSIQCDPDPSVFLIVFDRILHQIVHRQRKLHFVDIGRDIALTLKDQLDIPLSGDRTQTFQYHLDQSVDLDLTAGKSCGRFIHSNQCQKIVNYLALAVDLVGNIMHKFLIKLFRRILHSHQGVRKNSDRCDWGLKLVGDIGNEFLSRLVHRL